MSSFPSPTLLKALQKLLPRQARLIWLRKASDAQEFFDKARAQYSSAIECLPAGSLKTHIKEELGDVSCWESAFKHAAAGTRLLDKPLAEVLQLALECKEEVDNAALYVEPERNRLAGKTLLAAVKRSSNPNQTSVRVRSAVMQIRSVCPRAKEYWQDEKRIAIENSRSYSAVALKQQIAQYFDCEDCLEEHEKQVSTSYRDGY